MMMGILSVKLQGKMTNKAIESDSESAFGGDEHPQWMRVATAMGIANATIIAGRLEAEGIMTRVTQEAAGVSVFPVNVGLLSEAHVWVPEESYDQAAEILGSDWDEEE